MRLSKSSAKSKIQKGKMQMQYNPQNPNNPRNNADLSSALFAPKKDFAKDIKDIADIAQDSTKDSPKAPISDSPKNFTDFANSPNAQSLKPITSPAYHNPAESNSLSSVFDCATSIKSQIRIVEKEPSTQFVRSQQGAQPAHFGQSTQSAQLEVRLNPNERNELFSAEEAQKDEGLNVRYLIYAYLGLGLFLLVCMPKIWLSSSIYYTSRDINKLQTQRDLLQEENKRLQNEREKLRYQYLKLNSQPHPTR